MWNRSLGAAIVDCITVCVLLVAATGIIFAGYEYANVCNERNQLIEVVEEVSAERAMLEGMISNIPSTRPDATHQGWIPPSELEN